MALSSEHARAVIMPMAYWPGLLRWMEDNGLELEAAEVGPNQMRRYSVIPDSTAPRSSVPVTLDRRPVSELTPDLERIRAVTSLARREVELLAPLARGCTNGEIARRMGVSEETVKSTIRRARLKLGAADRANLVAIAIQTGLLR